MELDGIPLGTADDGETVGTLDGLLLGVADEGISVGTLVGRNVGADVGDLVGVLVPTIGAAELGTRDEGLKLDGIEDVGDIEGALVGESVGGKVSSKVIIGGSTEKACTVAIVPGGA
jgi:hypothetical protein